MQAKNRYHPRKCVQCGKISMRMLGIAWQKADICQTCQDRFAPKKEHPVSVEVDPETGFVIKTYASTDRVGASYDLHHNISFDSLCKLGIVGRRL